MKLPDYFSDPKQTKLLSILSALFLGLVFLGVFQIRNLNKKVSEVANKQDDFESTFVKSFYEDHLRISQQLGLNSNLETVSQKLKELSELPNNEEYLKVSEVYSLYGLVKSKITRNTNVKLDTSSANTALSGWGEMFIAKNYDQLIEEMATITLDLDTKYEEYIASLPPPPSQTGEGYSYTNVSTERGTFGVYLIKVPLSSVRVVTASASGDDCEDNCPTKSLAQHISDNGGYAGMNAGYFCPPDYEACSGKVNSTDYAFYKSSSGQWLQEDALSWGDTGLATFNGSSARFYKRSSDYDGDSVTAGVSNYPALLEDGDVVVDPGILTSY